MARLTVADSLDTSDDLDQDSIDVLDAVLVDLELKRASIASSTAVKSPNRLLLAADGDSGVGSADPSPTFNRLSPTSANQLSMTSTDPPVDVESDVKSLMSTSELENRVTEIIAESVADEYEKEVLADEATMSADHELKQPDELVPETSEIMDVSATEPSDGDHVAVESPEKAEEEEVASLPRPESSRTLKTDENKDSEQNETADNEESTFAFSDVVENMTKLDADTGADNVNDKTKNEVTEGGVDVLPNGEDAESANSESEAKTSHTQMDEVEAAMGMVHTDKVEVSIDSRIDTPPDPTEAISSSSEADAGSLTSASRTREPSRESTEQKMPSSHPTQYTVNAGLARTLGIDLSNPQLEHLKAQLNEHQRKLDFAVSDNRRLLAVQKHQDQMLAKMTAARAMPGHQLMSDRYTEEIRFLKGQIRQQRDKIKMQENQLKSHGNVMTKMYDKTKRMEDNLRTSRAGSRLSHFSLFKSTSRDLESLTDELKREQKRAKELEANLNRTMSLHRKQLMEEVNRHRNTRARLKQIESEHHRMLNDGTLPALRRRPTRNVAIMTDRMNRALPKADLAGGLTTRPMALPRPGNSDMPTSRSMNNINAARRPSGSGTVVLDNPSSTSNLMGKLTLRDPIKPTMPRLQSMRNPRALINSASDDALLEMVGEPIPVKTLPVRRNPYPAGRLPPPEFMASTNPVHRSQPNLSSRSFGYRPPPMPMTSQFRDDQIVRVNGVRRIVPPSERDRINQAPFDFEDDSLFPSISKRAPMPYIGSRRMPPMRARNASYPRQPNGVRMPRPAFSWQNDPPMTRMKPMVNRNKNARHYASGFL